MPRNPGYDRTEVVDRAMAVFWERGYGQTSVGDLVEATGLRPGSLYAAFGSKKGVFLEVLEAYNEGFLSRIRELGDGPRSTIEDLRGMLLDIVDETVAGKDHRGCLSVNALLELAQHDPDVADALDRHSQRIRLAFEQSLEQAREAGEITADKDIKSLSAFLMNNLWGMRVMCRGRPSRATMSAVVDGVMAAIDSPSRMD